MHFATDPSLAAADFEIAAKTIGFAAASDWLDGGIARLTNTASEFGRELDSLADIISFGIAPSVLAYAWGIQFVHGSLSAPMEDQFRRLGTFFAFFFLVCGAMRLARFNIQKNPKPRNPGPPHRKYFVGLPIPAAASVVAAVVYAFDSYPVTDIFGGVLWMALLGLLSFLMVSTWRYWSFKDLNLLRPRNPLILIFICAVFYAAFNWSQVVLVSLAAFYAGSGIAIRLGGVIRRHFPHPPRRNPEAQVG